MFKTDSPKVIRNIACATAFAAVVLAFAVSAQADTATTPAKRGFMSGTFFDRLSFTKQSLNDQTGAPTAFLFGQLDYNFTESKQVSVRQEMNYQFSGDPANPKKLSPSDIFIAYTDTNLALLKGGYTLTGSFRLYFPTGDASRFQTKQNGGAMAWFILSNSSGAFDWDFHLFSVYYNQTQNSYLDDTGKLQANAIYEMDPAVDISYNFASRWSLSAWLESENITNKAVDGQVRDLRHIGFEPGLVFKPLKKVSITASYYDYIDTSTFPGKLYLDKDCQYRLTLIASF